MTCMKDKHMVGRVGGNGEGVPALSSCPQPRRGNTPAVYDGSALFITTGSALLQPPLV